MILYVEMGFQATSIFPEFPLVQSCGSGFVPAARFRDPLYLLILISTGIDWRRGTKGEDGLHVLFVVV